MRQVNDNPNLFGCESQNQKILDYLRNGETLTTLEALLMFSSIRLPSRMQDLGRKSVAWDSAPRCRRTVLVDGKPKTTYVSGYFIPEYFGKRYHIDMDDIQQMRDLAKVITEQRINRK